MNIKNLFSKKRTENFNCVHFVILAAKELYSIDLTKDLLGLSKYQANFKTNSKSKFKLTKQFPEKGVVLFSPPSHIGLIWKGKILHLSKNVQYVDLDLIKIKFSKYHFYKFL